MVAYVIARMTLHKANKPSEYASLDAPRTERFCGRRLARGGELTNHEGTTCDDRMVIAGFPNTAAATALFSDPDYRVAAKIRDVAVTIHMLTLFARVDDQDLPGAGV